jgi:hypothetical protein
VLDVVTSCVGILIVADREGELLVSVADVLCVTPDSEELLEELSASVEGVVSRVTIIIVFDNENESSVAEPPCVSLDEVVERPLSVIAWLVFVESAFRIGIVEEKLGVIVVVGTAGMELPLCVM